MRYNKKISYFLGTTAALLTLSATSAMAAGYQLWEQNAGGVGDYHAGGAAEANDATTTYYNPAGLTRIKHTQIVMGSVLIDSDIRYRGNVSLNTLDDPDSGYIDTQGGSYAAIPNVDVAVPITQRLVFGFGMVVPFGSQTRYDASSPIRYAGTDTSIKTVDVGPSLGFQVTDKFSIGAGIAAEYMRGEFDQYAGLDDSSGDTLSENIGSDWAPAWNVGALYQFTPGTRIGVAYHGRVTHDLTGSSTFTGPLATSNPTPGVEAVARSNRFSTTLISPASTTLSFYQEITQKFSWDSSVTYTQWGQLNNITLSNVEGFLYPGNDPGYLNVDISQHLRNTWNIAVGGAYQFADQWKWKFGAGFDQSSVNTNYRNIQMPDANRVAIATGLHYTPTQHVGVDLGWTHLFLQQVNIDNTQSIGPTEIVTTNGSVKSSADVFGLQMAYSF